MTSTSAPRSATSLASGVSPDGRQRRPSPGRVASPTGPPQITVVLVEDQQLLADALSAIMTDEGIEVVVVCPDESFGDVAGPRPDVVLVDIEVAGSRASAISGVLLDVVKGSYPGVPLVALTTADAPDLTREAALAGFDCFLTKDAGIAEFLEELRAITAGRGRLGNVGAGAPHRTSSERHVQLMIEQLTPRELDVLELLADGAPTETIADALTISRHTVRSHVQNILAKLQLHSRLEAAAFAIRHRLVDPRADGRRRTA